MEISDYCELPAILREKGTRGHGVWKDHTFSLWLQLILMFPAGSLWVSPENRKTQAKNTVLRK
jgi:hypothetical protein